MMYFNFLKDRVINWKFDDEKDFNWSSAQGKFIQVDTLSLNEIAKEEERLLAFGYHFPVELKAFWNEIGCGYLSPDDNVDNSIDKPHAILDIYLNEGDWANVHFNCNLFAPNELPFFRITDLDYITIGLQEGVNLGKIYRFGEEIAPSLVQFIENILVDDVYYNNQTATK